MKVKCYVFCESYDFFFFFLIGKLHAHAMSFESMISSLQPHLCEEEVHLSQGSLGCFLRKFIFHVIGREVIIPYTT